MFDLDNVEWQRIQPLPEHRNPAVWETYRSHFPELWESHQLILDITSATKSQPAIAPPNPMTVSAPASGTVLKLFVSGHSALTEQILKTLQGVLESSRHRSYTLQMVDVSKDPAQAEADQISATPTLIRVWPKPVRRLVGELDNLHAILNLLSE
jgi:circadian clock protein KaiB